jgi:hypothetical protein
VMLRIQDVAVESRLLGNQLPIDSFCFSHKGMAFMNDSRPRGAKAR